MKAQYPDFNEFSEISISGKILNREQCRKVLDCPDIKILALLDSAYAVRYKYFKNIVNVQLLTNAKSGLCKEDCHYCSQSRISEADIKKYPLMSKDKLVGEALKATNLNAVRYCMALSGTGPSDAEIDALCDIIRTIKNKSNISLCCSTGFLTMEKAKKLKDAGLNRVNHNLNTSKRFHPLMCTTHSYEDRLNTISICRKAGLEVCSGGIVGQGETDEDIIDLLLSLREINAESVPINFLVPIKGTPFENQTQNLTPQRCLKILCLARFLNPDREIRAAGGREYHLRTLQPLALYAANSIFVAGYLTTSGQPAKEAKDMIYDLGFDSEIEASG